MSLATANSTSKVLHSATNAQFGHILYILLFIECSSPWKENAKEKQRKESAKEKQHGIVIGSDYLPLLAAICPSKNAVFLIVSSDFFHSSHSPNF